MFRCRPISRAVTVALAASMAVSVLGGASTPAFAAHLQRSAIFGAWQCSQFCQMNGALATISTGRTGIAGIECKNERGELSIGQLVSRTAVNCFNATATVSNDGETIVWSSGAVWRRNHLQEF